jgi:polar amino acid transport system substrate-binding protein
MGFVALEFTRGVAARLGVQMTVVEHPTPPAAVASIKSGACDVAFLGIEPSRAAEVDFSPPVIQFDYSFLVPHGSPVRNFADADRPGLRIAVVRNHASTFALSRKVQHAELVGSELPEAAFELLRAGTVDALAAPREQLLDYSTRLPGSRVVEEAYGYNNVGIAIAKGRTERLAFIGESVEYAKATGLIERIIERGALPGFRVAPPGNAGTQ